MNRVHLLPLAAALLVTACATEQPPTARLKAQLGQVSSGDYGEWLQHRAAADRNLDVADRAMRQMEQDHYWNITEMQQMAGAAAGNALQERQKAEEVYKRMVDKRLHHLDFMHVSEEQAAMVVEGLAYFPTGSATPSKVDHAAIDKIAAVFRQYPVGYAEVVGYTDTVGSESLNHRLADARARTVASMLRKHGIDRVEGHVVAVGKGEAGGPPDTANQKDRRVDVKVYPHESAPE